MGAAFGPRFRRFLSMGLIAAPMWAALWAGTGSAAEPNAGEVGGVPVVIGEPGQSRGTVEIDMEGVAESDVPLNEPRPQSLGDRPRDGRPGAQSPPILSVSVEGNSQVVSSHILSVVTSQAGSPLDQNRLSRDADAIFEQGFFSNADYRIVDEIDGAHVIFMVTENPTIEDIRFFGNETYSEEKLREICFTKPGMIFNRVFFRNDLQRIKEKYQQDGYVMARVNDVKIEGRVVNVYIMEPRIGDIVIQGNKRTKTYVISRQLRLEKGDLFNSTKLRYTLNKLQGLGYFEDVNVGFEPGDTEDAVNLILTVAEAKTARIGVSVGYGTQSGFSGGLSYSDNNWRGRGESVGIGFDVGDREQYWLTLEQPYMDHKVFAWRAGAYKRMWKNLGYYDDDLFQFEYDEDRVGAYVGLGRKFSARSKLSWFITTEWQNIDIDARSNANLTQIQLEEMESGKNLMVSARVTRGNMDEYSPYPKGDTESIIVEKGLDGFGGEWSYWKYWLEAKYYTPMNFLTNLFERNFTVDDVPPIIAARMIIGDSEGYLPWAVDYTLGGDSTLRGYEDKRFRGGQMFLLNTELRLPVHRTASLVFFYDIGRTWDTNAGEKIDFGDMADAYGIGVRVRTPIGNLRLDFAQGDEESRVHFGFGEMF
ncbi:MAG: BamA/TamA family outer membrane protein [Synergistaceae bacterium]|jgi:outer membrane protein insertion porin family|nr:BamA/TamA family outer membrane protein [Synergistaceae bacterium]